MLTAAILMFRAARKFRFWESWHEEIAAREQSDNWLVLWL